MRQIETGRYIDRQIDSLKQRETVPVSEYQMSGVNRQIEREIDTQIERHTDKNRGELCFLEWVQCFPHNKTNFDFI